MAIAAKRFQCFDGETDSAVQDMLSAGSGLYNSAKNELADISATTADFIDQATQSLPDVNSLIDEAKSVLNGGLDSVDGFLSDAKTTAKDVMNSETVRGVKSLYGDIKDIALNGSKMVDEQIKSLFAGVPGVGSAFSSMSNNCKNRASGFGGMGKPYDASFSCNGRDKTARGGACNSSSFNDVLNKLTGGEYNSSYTDLNKTLAGLMGLSKFGYDLNMCGVFGALSSNVTNLNGSGAGLLSRASAGLAGTLSSDKNTYGLLDLAGASAALNPKLEYPGIATGFFKGVNIPLDIAEDELSGLYERVAGAAEIFDSDYAASSLGDMASLCNLDMYNKDLGEMMEAGLMDSVPDMDNLESIIEPDEFSASFLAWRDSEALAASDVTEFELAGFDKLW